MPPRKSKKSAEAPVDATPELVAPPPPPPPQEPDEPKPVLITPTPTPPPDEKPKKKRVAKKKVEFVDNSAPPQQGDTVLESTPMEDVDNGSSVVVIQLPIPPNRIQDILQSELGEMGKMSKRGTDNPNDPLPYDNDDKFLSNPGDIDGDTQCATRPKPASVCFWCCHELDTTGVGLPIRHDIVHNTFTLFGTFCSMECASAFNFSHHQGSERLWEINSWVHLLARNMGLCTPIRPAPSRYMLKLFGGPMTIEKFRQAHNGMSRTFVQNIPPMITVNPQMEVVNTSFLVQTGALDMDKVQQANDKVRLSRQKSVVDFKNTLDSKINLSYVEVM
jgi:hypothetical protein